MKSSLFTLPELGFIVFVMVLPFGLALFLTHGSPWGFVVRLLAFMLAGCFLWAVSIWLICRHHDRKTRRAPDSVPRRPDNPSSAMPNSIHNLDTKVFRNDTGEFPAIVMGLDMPDSETADAFLDHVIEQFKNQRMCSPPTTANMTITLTGSITADQFRDLWSQRVATDPILKAFMSMMVVADVLHIRGRDILDHASLITSK